MQYDNCYKTFLITVKKLFTKLNLPDLESSLVGKGRFLLIIIVLDIIAGSSIIPNTIKEQKTKWKET